jgi:ParB family chromosome partitioning protein
MGKLDELMKSSRGIAAESMGRLEPSGVMHGASVPAMPDRLQGITRSKSAAEIPLDKLAPDPDQPREEFDEASLARLAESLRTRGQLQPIRVRWDEEQSRYLIVCGERRWRAAKLAGLPSMSCVIMDAPATPSELLALQLVENLVREDLKPIEQAKAFRSVMDAHGWSTHDVARELAIDQSSVVRALRLLELPATVQEQVEKGALPPATAYEVSKLDDPAEQVTLVRRVVAEKLSRAQTADEVKRSAARSPRAKAAKGKPARKPTSRVFRRMAGCTVTVENARGLDPALIRAALSEAIACLGAEETPDATAA